MCLTRFRIQLQMNPISVLNLENQPDMCDELIESDWRQNSVEKCLQEKLERKRANNEDLLAGQPPTETTLK